MNMSALNELIKKEFLRDEIRELDRSVWYRLCERTYAMPIKNCGCLVRYETSPSAIIFVSGARLFEKRKVFKTFDGGIDRWDVEYFMEGTESLKQGPYR